MFSVPLANTILHCHDEALTPHELQWMLYLTVSEYGKISGNPDMVGEPFTCADYGPMLEETVQSGVLWSLKSKCETWPTHKTIDSYIVAAGQQKPVMVNADRDPALRYALDRVWHTQYQD